MKSIHNGWNVLIYGPNAYRIPFFPTSVFPPANITADQLAIANYDMRLWTMVKSWELQNSFTLNDKTPVLYQSLMSDLQKRGLQSTNADVTGLIEPRGWVFEGASFLTSPHGVDPNNLITASYAGDLYIHESWYYLQLILNPGMGTSGGNADIDFGYFTGTSLGSTGPKTAVFTAPTLPAGTTTAELAAPFTQIMPYPLLKDSLLTLKAWHERDGGTGPSQWGVLGWSPSRLARDISFASGPAGTSLNSVVPADLPLATSKAVLTAILHAWLTKNKAYSNQEFYNGYSNLPTDTSALSKGWIGKSDVNSTVATASEQSSVCSFGITYTAGDQICPFSRPSGYLPSVLVSPPNMLADSQSTLAGIVTWRGGALAGSAEEILAWSSQLFPKIDMYGIANEGVPFCQANQNLRYGNNYACAGSNGVLASPVTR